jgi:anti-sigma factor RsiW
MPSPDNLSSLLAVWRVNPALNPAFRAAVRSKLDADESTQSWLGFARRHAAFVAGLMVLASAAGAWGGQASARMRVAEARERLASAYVQSLDARAMSRP